MALNGRLSAYLRRMWIIQRHPAQNGIGAAIFCG
jgi:hypothetical protein